jgi:hypothetical protein
VSHPIQLTASRDMRFLEKIQGRSDGVSRVSNAYGPIFIGGPPEEKKYIKYFRKNYQKHKNYRF